MEGELGSRPLSAIALIAAAPERLCVEGFEIRFPQGRDTDLTAVFSSRGAAAAIRAELTTERVACALEPPVSAAP